ncbi:restriction endonuclease subunit S [Bacillus altitudinis]|uniref:restriction endonuclease subunit S n=1 Tax=Bacillus altitudinis TaxID=293387 RepID=UPI001C22C799|nr:restriction endonuclease subunit S [Bacillus altitudinis]MBU8691972.1 restriction endonuclease subunit S [Bacillus altitudinis]
MSKKKKTIEELLEEAIVPEEKQRFGIPENWIWTQTGSITDVIGGGTPKSTVKEYFEDGDIPWLTPADLSGYQDMYISRGKRNITEVGLANSSAKILPSNTVLLSSRAPIGYVTIASNDICTNQGFKSFLPSNAYYPEYLYWYLKFSTTYLESMASGTTFKELSGSKCKEIALPLPPINEQKRIADKVERLISKIDEAKQLIEEAKKTFELRRAAILDKAFRGDLTRKWREENADIDIFEVQEHLDRLRADKESSPIKSNTLNVKSVNEDDEPFNLPRGWKWARLGELSYYVTSGSRDWSKYYANHGSYFIRTQDINKNKLNLANVAYVLLPEKVEGKRSLVEPFDLLTTITGANVGKCAIVEEIIPEAYVSQSVALTKLIDKSMAQYVHLSLLSTCGGGGELENRAYGIGRPVLSLEDIKNIRLPIAPYRERQVIINMVKKLLDMEETTGNLLLLEEKLDQLKNSILSKAFRGEIGTNDPSEESALELLKEMLQEQVN